MNHLGRLLSLGVFLFTMAIFGLFFSLQSNLLSVQQIPNFHPVWTLVFGLLLATIFAIVSNFGIRNAVAFAKNGMEKEVFNAKSEARKARRGKLRFFANMNHGIRTPITTIIGMTNILESTELTSNQKDCLRTIFLASEHLKAVTGDILDYSKLESGQINLESKLFSLLQTLEESIEIIGRKALSKNIGLVSYLEGEFPAFVMGDANRTKQILLNLLSNAIHFTKEGQVILTAKMGYYSTDEGAFQAELIVSVDDTGAGIKKSEQRHLFHAYGGRGRIRARSGSDESGLGLIISKKLAVMMGGDLWLDKSTLGEGSTFVFKVPFEYFKFPKHSQQILSQAYLDFEDKDIEKHITCRLKLLGVKIVDFVSADHVFSDNLLRDPEIAGSKSSKKLVHLNSRLISSKEQFLSKSICHCSFDNVLTLKALREVMQSISLATAEFAPPDSKILIAEDNSLNQKVIQKMLEQWGCHITVCDNGAQAYEHTLKENFDIYILDMHMPIMGGIEACKLIKSHCVETGENPVMLALTADFSSEMTEHCHLVGFHQVLLKPISSAKLKNIIFFYLNRIKGRTEPHKLIRRS